jgi:hypothetical protein
LLWRSRSPPDVLRYRVINLALVTEKHSAACHLTPELAASVPLGVCGSRCDACAFCSNAGCRMNRSEVSALPFHSGPETSAMINWRELG